MKLAFITQFEKDELINAIAKIYNLEISAYKEIPVGEESTSFMITTIEGSKFFAKHCTKDFAIKHIETANNLLIELKQLGVAFVVSPVMKNSQTSFDILGGKLYLYPYIEGNVVRMSNDEFPKELLEKLTKMLTTLYKLSTKITTKLPKEEYLSTNSFRFAKLLKMQPVNNKEVFNKIITDSKFKLEEIVHSYEDLGVRLKSENIPNYLTHGDVTGLNIIQGKDGLFLTDWDGVMFAPTERDLMFLVSNENFDMGSFLKETGKREYRKDIVDYYSMQWALDSIFENFEVLANNNLDSEGLKSTVAEIEMYLGWC